MIEAAGNGNVNLDQAACSGVFDRTVRDSGAIIVGAGQPPSSGVDRQREGFSTFGSRVDLQGWGSGVVTTGYGDLYQNPDRPTDPDFWYTVVLVVRLVPHLSWPVRSQIYKALRLAQSGNTTRSFTDSDVVGADGKPTVGEYCRAYRPSS